MSEERKMGVCTQDKETEVSGAVRQPAEQAVTRGQRMTFREAVDIAARQIELASFKTRGVVGADWRLAFELCKIMAEVMTMQDKGQAKIGGELLDAYLVKQVFAELRAEHVAWVMDIIRTRGAGNAMRKLYVRSMLYNSVFEIESASQSGIESGSQSGIESGWAGDE